MADKILLNFYFVQTKMFFFELFYCLKSLFINYFFLPERIGSRDNIYEG